MAMKKLYVQVACSFLIIISTYFSARACQCGPTLSPYTAYHDAKAVFVGRVASSRDVAIYLQARDNTTYTAYERHFRFVVNESLKDAKTAELEVNSGSINSLCYTGFTVGDSYLVYAYEKSNGTLASGLCARTDRLEEATDDLHYLRAMLRGVPEPRVYGSVMKVENDLTKTKSRLTTPLPGIKVIVEGAGRRFESVTDKEGLYEIPKVPDGRYKLRPSLPKKYRGGFPAEEEFVLGVPAQFNRHIQQGTAFYGRFRIGWRNDLSGKVLDAEGNPILQARVTLMIARKNTELVIEEDEKNYRHDGKYQFSALTPGRYLLSVSLTALFGNAKKASRFYFPGTSDATQAVEITVGESESLEERDIRLPAEYVVRQIEGVLVWPNGTPVSRGSVCLGGSQNAGESIAKEMCTSTDELGRFSLQGFVGAAYQVQGESYSSGKGQSIKITVGKNNESLKVVIPFPKPITDH